MTTFATADASALGIPDLPDRARMYRESGATAPVGDGRQRR